MLLAAVLLTVVCASWIVLYVLPRRRMTSLTRTIPGPTGLPLLGNSLMLRGSPTQIFNKFIELHEKYGSIYKLWIGPKLYVFISNPADAQSVLHNSKVLNRDSDLGRAIGQYLGNGLITSRDETWRRHHKLIRPAFSYKNLEPYLKIFQNKANILVEKLAPLADGRIIDVHHVVELCMLDAICETAIGVDMKIQESGESRLSEGLPKARDMIVHRMLNPWLLVDWIYEMSPHYKTSQSLVKIGHEFSEEIIATKLANYRNGSNKSTSSGKKIQSFLDIIIEASERGGQILSPDEIRDEVSTMALTGTDTVTGVLSWVLVLLGIHQDHQDKIDQEMLAVFGDSDREAEIEDIRQLKHVDYCIKETLRMFPMAPFSLREIPEDIEITGGRILPAGSTAVVHSFPMHRSAEYYSDPGSFCPERWTPESSTERQTGAYLPFAAGLRMCVGYKYALLILPTVLIAILRRYRVYCSTHTVDQLSKNVAIGIAIYSSVGHKIQLTKK